MIEQRPGHIDSIFIHCAATPNGRAHTAADINHWHGPDRAKQGLRPFLRQSPNSTSYNPHLKHIGYHFVIGVDGELETGREFTEVGAHTAGYNTNSIGICMVGTDAFSPAQWNTLTRIVLCLQIILPAVEYVRGHREVNKNKTCPGFSVARWLDDGMTPQPINVFNP